MLLHLAEAQRLSDTMHRKPRIKIFKNQSPVVIEDLYAAWVDERMSKLESLGDSVNLEEEVDLLRIPSETHLSWFQGLQCFVLSVIYNEHPLESEDIKE